MACTDADDSEVFYLWEKKKEIGNSCINALSGMMGIHGVEKLARDIQKDVDFLENMTAKDFLQVKSSNINRFDAVVRCLMKQRGVQAVLEPYKKRINGMVMKAITVDIVCHINLQEFWIKVIAKSRQTLTSAVMGDCPFGRRNIVDQAKDFVELSMQNKFNYRPPKIIFHFDSGVDSCVARAIMDLGIKVSGEIENDDDDDMCDLVTVNNDKDFCMDMLDTLDRETFIKKLNLDVCAMIGYVSELTNGGSDLVCENRVFNQQAQAERVLPLCPILDELFEGRQLLCCGSALEAFMGIVETLGGPKEKERSEELINRLTIVADCDRPITLKLNKKITWRSAIVFMTGDDYEAITITANNGLAKAAASQGQKFSVFIIEARSLTEKASISMGEM